MDVVPADIKCIINETGRKKQDMFQAGYGEQIHSHTGWGEGRRTKIRLKNDPVLSCFQEGALQVSLERGILFCDAGHFPILQIFVAIRKF